MGVPCLYNEFLEFLLPRIRNPMMAVSNPTQHHMVLMRNNYFPRRSPWDRRRKCFPDLEWRMSKPRLQPAQQIRERLKHRRGNACSSLKHFLDQSRLTSFPHMWSPQTFEQCSLPFRTNAGGNEGDPIVRLSPRWYLSKTKPEKEGFANGNTIEALWNRTIIKVKCSRWVENLHAWDHLSSLRPRGTCTSFPPHIDRAWMDVACHVQNKARDSLIVCFLEKSWRMDLVPWSMPALNCSLIG